VGQARAFGQAAADPAILKGLKELLEKRPKLDPATPDQIKELDVAAKAFAGTLKEKTGPDLARAVVEAVSEAHLDAGMVKLLDAIVPESTFDVVELRLVHQLATRAKRAHTGEGDDETAQLIWDTVLLAEEASNRALTMRWVRFPTR
jgi:hypothetical protein